MKAGQRGLETRLHVPHWSNYLSCLSHLHIIGDEPSVHCSSRGTNCKVREETNISLEMMGGGGGKRAKKAEGCLCSFYMYLGHHGLIPIPLSHAVLVPEATLVVVEDWE